MNRAVRIVLQSWYDFANCTETLSQSYALSRVSRDTSLGLLRDLPITSFGSWKREAIVAGFHGMESTRGRPVQSRLRSTANEFKINQAFLPSNNNRPFPLSKMIEIDTYIFREGRIRGGEK